MPPGPEPERMAGFVRRSRVSLMVMLALLLVAWHLAVIFCLGSARIDGKLHFLINDDEMITMRYGRNLATGAGLVYNPGERVEGFTSPLMALFMTGIHFLPAPAALRPAFVQLLNLGLSLAALFMLFRFFGDDGCSRLAGMVAGLFYVFLPNHSYHAHAGFEVYMTSAFLVWTLRRIDRMTVPAALVAGLLPLTHATAGASWIVIVVAMILFNRSRPSRALLLAAAAALPVVAWEIFRLAYYAAALPNSFYLKAGAGTFAGGFAYLGGWLATIPALGIVALFAFARTADRKIATLGACVVAQAAAAVVVGGDIFPQYRFLFPVSVLLCAAAGWGVATAAWELPGLRRPWKGLAAGLLVCAVGVLVEPIGETREGIRISIDLREWNVQHVAIGEAIRDNTPSGSTVALFGLGYAGYYSERPVIDMLGKVDSHIARVEPNRARVIGHSKSDVGYVLSRAPDFVECGVAPSLLGKTSDLENGAAGPWGYNAELALNAEFQRLYAPNPVRDEQGRFAYFYARSADDVRASWKASGQLHPHRR